MKDQHQVDHPDYVYKPRKTSEKKRRMSRKKTEKLAKLFETLSGSMVPESVQDVFDAFAGENVTANNFTHLAEDGENSFVLLGDLELTESNLDTLLDAQNFGLPALHGSQPVDMDNTGRQDTVNDNETTSGFVAFSTAAEIDAVNDIIAWAEAGIGPAALSQPTRFAQKFPGVPNHVVRRTAQIEYDNMLSGTEIKRQEYLCRNAQE